MTRNDFEQTYHEFVNLLVERSDVPVGIKARAIAINALSRKSYEDVKEFLNNTTFVYTYSDNSPETLLQVERDFFDLIHHEGGSV